MDKLKKVQKILERDNLDVEVRNVINELASENIVLEKKAKGTKVDEDVFPDVDAITYKAAVSEGNLTAEENSIEVIRSKIQEYLRDNHSDKFLNITADRAMREAVLNEIRNYCVREGIKIKGRNMEETIDKLQKDILDYKILTDLIFDYDRPEDEKIEEVRVDDWNDIRIVIKGEEYKTKLKFESSEQAYETAKKICRTFDAPLLRKSNPFVRVRMGNNIRASMMGSPVSRRSDNLEGKVVNMAIRKQSSKPLTKEFLLKDTINGYGYDLVDTFMRHKISMNFYGGTNSGKTGTMAAFAKNLKTRTITIAETDEMNLRNVDSVTGEARNSVVMWEIKPSKGIGYREAVNAALTFTPETLVLQETKGGEIVDITGASITGHQIITTSHARDKKVFGLRSLEMYKQSGSDLRDELVLNFIVAAFPIVVRMKIYEDGKRRIADIGELTKYNKEKDELETKTLLEFQVEDTIEEKVYDKYLKEEVTKLKVIGKHKVKEFLSENLQKMILENGGSKALIKNLESKFNNLKEQQEGR